MGERIFLCVYLGFCSFYDCRTMRIPVWLLHGGLLLGSLYAGGKMISGMAGWQAVMAGILPGTIMLLYGRLSDGKLGEADGKMVILAGLLQHWERCTAQVLAACFLVFFAAMFLLLTQKGTRHTRIPFAPFFLAAVVLLWIGEIFGGLICG